MTSLQAVQALMVMLIGGVMQDQIWLPIVLELRM